MMQSTSQQLYLPEEVSLPFLECLHLVLFDHGRQPGSTNVSTGKGGPFVSLVLCQA